MISVIVPVYNRLELLKEALHSIDKQTYTDFEVLIADDGSTDGSREWAEEWVKNRCGQVFPLEHSGFPGLVRNRAAEKAQGDWLAFLDSDDLWKPDKLQKQIEKIEEHPTIPLWHCREIWQRQNRIVSQRKQRHQREGSIFSDALIKCIIGPSTVLIRKDLWQQCGGFREDLEIAEDYELWLRLCSRVEVGYLDEALTIKRAGDWDQLSEKYGQIEVFRIEGLRYLVESRWFASEVNAETQQLAEEELVRKCRIYSQGCLKRQKREEAAEYTRLADLIEKQLPL